MLDFIVSSVLWILALYGLLEIFKNIIKIKTYTKIKTNGTYIIIATKNQEEEIEGFMRSFIFECLYEKKVIVENIIVVDLNSIDSTRKILKKLEKDYAFIKLIDWKECKDLIDKININEKSI